MTKPMTKVEIQAFINLLRNPIDGNDWDYENDKPNGNSTKIRFQKLGKKLLKEIATRLNIPAEISWNPGGVAVSGDLYLKANGIYINFSQTALGFDFGFMYRYGEDGANRWMQWNELLDLDRLCAHFKQPVNAKECRL